MSNPDWNPYPDRWWLANYGFHQRVVAASFDWSVLAYNHLNDWHYAFPTIYPGVKWEEPVELPMEYCL